MRLVLLDEAGSPYSSYKAFLDGYDKALRVYRQGAGSPPAYPFFVLAAVAIAESHREVIDEWVLRQKQSFLGAGPLDSGPQYEIKGSILYSLLEGLTPPEWSPTRGKKPKYTPRQKALWSKLTPAELAELERSLFDLFRRLAPTIWVVVVRQADIFFKHGTKTWLPLYWALTYLQQRVAQFVQVERGSYEQALFVMDESTTLSNAAQFNDFLRTRAAINATASWPVEFRRTLVDVPLAGKSHLIQGLQLPDVTAHAVWRWLHKNDTRGWFAQIEPLLARHWTTGRYYNAGLTFIH